jgi:hypothetical protein
MLKSRNQGMNKQAIIKQTSIKKIQFLAMGAMLVSASQAAHSLESKSDTLIYISPLEYSHSVRLLSPYYDYWFEQGPIVEPIVLKALSKQDNSVGMCKNNETADTIVRIKPQLFYNPQMKVYHGKMEATVFSGSGDVLGTYIGEAQQLGYTSFDNATRFHIEKVYNKAMNNLVAKLDLTHPANTAGGQKLPCGIIGNQNQPTFNFY